MKRIAFLSVFLSVAGIVLPMLFSPAAVYSQEGTAAPRTAPGTLITIPPEVEYDSVYNRADLTEVIATLKAVDPEIADDPRFKPEIWAKDVRFFRDVWCLQFSFKPVRIIYVDIPNKEGTFTKKAVWYLVYKVENIGPADFESKVKERTIKTESGERKVKSVEYVINKPGSISTKYDKDIPMPVASDTVAKSEYEDGKTNEVKQTRDAPLVLREMPGFFEPTAGEDLPIQFVPQFVLATDSLTTGTTSDINPETGKVETTENREEFQYVDQIIPIAIGPIMQKEGMSEIPENTVSIAAKAKELKSGENLWGLAMWTDIDPRITKFSVYVSGITNEYRWKDTGTATGNPGEGRTITQKYLKTNWWRRGDKYSLDSGQIQYGQPGTVDYEWIFR